MIINHNIAALNTYSKLNSAQNAQADSLAKLSSGQRINKAGDDAAGLAISEKMRSQIRGLDQAGRNAQDGISMIQTAEGALNETHSILQRMRELAVQASNDTNTADDRTQIQKEVDQLSSEINRIAGTTEFNKQTLLDGGKSANKVTGASSAVVNAGTDAQQAQITVSFTKCVDALNAACDIYVAGNNFYAQGCTTLACTTLTGSVSEFAAYINTKQAGVWTAQANGNTLTITAVAGGTKDGHQAGSFCLAGTTCYSATVVSCGVDACAQIQNLTFSNASVQEGVVINVGSQSIGLWNSNSGTYKNATDAAQKLGVTCLFDIYCANGGVICSLDLVCNSGGGADLQCTAGIGCFDLTFSTTGPNVLTITSCIGTQDAAVTKATINSAAGTAASAGNGITLQIGANTDQTFKATFSDMTGLGIKVTAGASGMAITASDGKVAYFNKAADVDKNGKTSEFSLDLSTSANATAAISVIDDAITAVSSERAKLGAYQNRLDHTINNLSTSSENLTAAESRIRDVDMAKEMMDYTKNNILSQASTAMLAQANQMPQGVLQLLR